jgi:hypothetical protein
MGEPLHFLSLPSGPYVAKEKQPLVMSKQFKN